MRIICGKVTSSEPDSNLGITFSIPGVKDLNPGPYAVPFTKQNRYPKKDDFVMVIQPEESVEVFYYVVEPSSDNTISLTYKDNQVLVEDSSIKLTCGKDGTTIEMSTTQVNVNGGALIISK